jgi:UDP-2,3-diacylglucosamine hydrolase
MTRTLFISDLHLSPDRPAIAGLFVEFLRTHASRAEALYILGDLFEYWLGDDTVDMPELAPLLGGLRDLTQSGVPVYVMHGNRDFLMGNGFERASGCKLLADPSVIDLYGTRVVLTHGDLLCTGDTRYQAVRRMVRDPNWQREVLAKTLPERISLARNFREQSEKIIAGNKPEIMDVAPAAVDEMLRAHDVRDMIHGHTHRPADHRFLLDGAPARRVVLGDWYDQGSVLVCDRSDWRLETLPVSSQPPATTTRRVLK